jgi:16S rRNA (adenine1518-N6/adenine1519-N6)-dimethyltransferase
MQPKKSLGQNFLIDQEVLTKMITVTQITADDLVLEIGSGRGALTAKIIKETKNFIAIEKDKKLAEKVAHNFHLDLLDFQSLNAEQSYKLKEKRGVISGDILKINLKKLIAENNFQNYKVIANIPYYITSALLRLFLETFYPPQKMFLMVQKEVAQRICASVGQMSLLAVSVQYYTQPKLLFEVAKESFSPSPKVDSAFIQLNYKVNKITPEERAIFFKVVRAGFSAKRKTLINNLANSLHLPKNILELKMIEVGLKNNQRPQELSMNNWRDLSQRLEKLVR